MPGKPDKGSIVMTSPAGPVHVGDTVTFALDFGKYGPDANPHFGFVDCRIVDPQSDADYAGGPSPECYLDGWQIGCPGKLAVAGYVWSTSPTMPGKHTARIFSPDMGKPFDHPIDKIDFDVV